MEPISHIPATRLPARTSLEALFDSSLSSFSFSWNPASIPHPARYAVFTDSSSLTVIFSSPIPAWTMRLDTCDQFVQGLWEYDVGEVFISHPATGRYQEFNLAPSGAWWTCLFSSYRTAEEKQPAVVPATIWQHSTAEGWQAAIEIPISGIHLPFRDLAELRFNICTIQGSSPRHYLSAATINTREPDFHHHDSFLALSS